jgi:hypothetical protein
VIGLTGAATLAILTIVLAFIDHSAPRELELARNALEDARDLERRLQYDYEGAEQEQRNLRRATELYSAMNSMREVIEQTANTRPDDIMLVQFLLAAGGRALMVASDFEISDHWTLLVYRTESAPEGPARQLRCVGGKRSIDCDLSEARLWPEGVGVGGVALSRGQEVLAPDLSKPELGTLYQSGALRRDHDAERYRSIAAVPIQIAGQKHPWGVVVATSDQANHFGVEQGPGVRTAEASRALAGMVALGVGIRDATVPAAVES